jgi:hypothetical protein
MKRPPARRLPPPHRVEGSTETRRIKLPRPHAAQQQVIDEAARFNTVVCGRCWGKSTLGMIRLVMPAIEGKPVAWCAPTYRMMVDTWEILQHVLLIELGTDWRWRLPWCARLGRARSKRTNRSSLFWASSDFVTAATTTGGCIANDLNHLISVSPEAPHGLVRKTDRLSGSRLQ